jgi:hypothetical protein
LEVLDKVSEQYPDTKAGAEADKLREKWSEEIEKAEKVPPKEGAKENKKDPPKQEKKDPPKQDKKDPPKEDKQRKAG